jgi:hypothetical protein
MLAGCSGNPSPNPPLGVFSCPATTLSGNVCNATCLYGSSAGLAPPTATCTDGTWNITGGTCVQPYAPPSFVTSSLSWTWFLASSCSADITDALVPATLVDLDGLLMMQKRTGVVSIAQASCATGVVSNLHVCAALVNSKHWCTGSTQYCSC